MPTSNSRKTFPRSMPLLLLLCSTTGCALQHAPNPQCYPAPPPKPVQSIPPQGQFSLEFERMLSQIGVTQSLPTTNSAGSSSSPGAGP